MSWVTALSALNDDYKLFSHMPFHPCASLTFDTSKLGAPIIRPPGKAIHDWTDASHYAGDTTNTGCASDSEPTQEAKPATPSSNLSHFGVEGSDPPRWETVTCAARVKLVHTPIKLWVVDIVGANDIVAEAEIIGLALNKGRHPDDM